MDRKLEMNDDRSDAPIYEYEPPQIIDQTAIEAPLIGVSSSGPS